MIGTKDTSKQNKESNAKKSQQVNIKTKTSHFYYPPKQDLTLKPHELNLITCIFLFVFIVGPAQLFEKYCPKDKNLNCGKKTQTSKVYKSNCNVYCNKVE